MSSKASSSKTTLPPPPLLPPPATSSTQLAPGFRFHPTDEELVSYYLKRKVTGRRIHVNAISEVDLYRSEPWDLPPQSRLRSRDLEWYFFTSLDRKYSNKCRTNRATAEGYWKTTGKDRPIQRRSRTIGRKKTLVYHSGRAPRGKRSNWVMHEYRLDDEDLARAEIPQDGYVLCRIFQKGGPGPQNGAQYGAPFMEEEWEREEEEDANFVSVNVDGPNELMDPAGNDYVQLGDFLQVCCLSIQTIKTTSAKEPEAGIQHLDALPFVERSAEPDSGSHTEDSSIFVDELFNVNDSVDDMPRNVDITALQGSKTTMNGLEDQLNCASIINNGYVQLNDIFGEETTHLVSNVYSTDCPLKKCSDSLEYVVGHSNILCQNDFEGDSLNTYGVTSHPDQDQMFPAVQHDIYPETYNPVGNVPWEYLSRQLTDDELVYYDALSHEVPYFEDSFVNETLTPEFDFPEDLMAYYDATNDNLNYTPPDAFMPQSNAFSKFVGSSNSSSKEAFNAGENLAMNAPSGSPATGDGPSSGLTGVPADAMPKDCQDNTLTKRLASMLDSISAPPAFADEAALIDKTVEQISATSKSVLHVSAGMIQIENLTTMGCADSFTLQKHSELRFLLSYGMLDSVISKSISHEPRNKVLGGFLSTVCRGCFHRFFLSALMLALSVKLVVYVYNM